MPKSFPPLGIASLVTYFPSKPDLRIEMDFPGNGKHDRFAF
jgi:hypothetical protein